MSTPGQEVAAQPQKRSLVQTLAAQYDMEPQPFLDAIAQTVMPTDRQASNAMIAAFLLVCNEHGLNPFTREIFAFPSKSGGIQPIVSVDGWVKLVNRHPAFAGMDLVMSIDDKTGKPISCTCTIYRNDRDHQIPITEYYDECYRNTDPWNKMPKRMMRHKALKEAARYTFGFAGIMDEDEGRDAINITAESTVIAKETATRTEALKEKIGAKKTAATPEKPAETLAIIPDPPTQPIEPTGNLEGLRAGVDSMIDELNGNKAEETLDFEDPERLLSDDERNNLLSILKSKGKNKEEEQIIAKAARQKFAELGYANTKQIRLKDLQACLDWSNAIIPNKA
jgi:phage recombination protein Bet